MTSTRNMRLVALLALSACGGSTEPRGQTLDDLAGTYQLTSTSNAGALPAYLHESVIDPNYGVQHIVGGSFTIASTGGATREAVRVEIIENDLTPYPGGSDPSRAWRDTITTPGAITLDLEDPRRFVFTSGVSATHGAISPIQVTLATGGEAGSRIYTR